MKEIKKISVNALEKVAKEQFTNQKKVEWNGLEITVTPSLSLTQMMGFVSNVVDACFSSDGEYLPEILDFAIQREVLTEYANFRLPEDLQKQYELICVTGVADVILEYVNQIQFREITRAIDRKLRYLSDGNVNKIRNDMTKLMSSFEEMQASATAMFEKLSSDDVQKFVGAVNNGGFSEKKIVEAYKDVILAKSEKESEA